MYLLDELLFRNICMRKFCISDGRVPSNKPNSLHNDFWNTLYNTTTTWALAQISQTWPDTLNYMKRLLLVFKLAPITLNSILACHISSLRLTGIAHADVRNTSKASCIFSIFIACLWTSSIIEPALLRDFFTGHMKV